MSALTYPISDLVHSFNEADEGILQDMILHDRLRKRRLSMYAVNELLDQPVGSQSFLKNGFVNVSALVASTTITLLTFALPRGYRGVLTSRSNWVSGSTLQEGSGVLTWSYKIGDGWLYDHGNVTYTISPDFTAALVGRGGHLLLPNTVVSVLLTTGADLSSLDPASVVLARLKGWYVPDLGAKGTSE